MTIFWPNKSLDTMKRNQIAWWFSAVGTGLIALSWFDVVSNKVGWCGFGLIMVGSVMEWGVRPPRSDTQPLPPTTDFEKKD